MIILVSSAMILVVALFLLSLMYRQANENNVLHHQVQVAGTEQAVRLFFISDTHARQIEAAMIQAIQPVHAVIIGGDFVDKRTTKACLVQNVATLSQLGPLYFVWGNNDREMPRAQLLEVFRQFDVTIIENDAVLLPNHSEPIWLSAIDYVAKPSPENIAKAFEKCEDARTVFTAHNPQVFPKVRAAHRPLLMMGGHLHGGQIRFGKFGMHSPGTFQKRDGVPTLISNGYGTSLLPLRFGAKPQCHVITINFFDEYTQKRVQ